MRLQGKNGFTWLACAGVIAAALLAASTMASAQDQLLSRNKPTKASSSGFSQAFGSSGGAPSSRARVSPRRRARTRANLGTRTHTLHHPGDQLLNPSGRVDPRKPGLYPTPPLSPHFCRELRVGQHSG